MEAQNIERCYEDYLQALLDGREDRATSVVNSALDRGAQPEELYVRVFQPALRHIGILWQHNRFHVAQEHLATAITRRLMAQFTPYFRTPTRQVGRTIVLACVANEVHEVGLQMVCDLYERDGWTVVYLGANVPNSDLLDFVQQVQPDVVGLSATLTHHLPTVQSVISGLRGAGCQARIVVGGYAFAAGKDLAAAIGAQLWTPDALQSLESTNSLFDDAAIAATTTLVPSMA